MQKVAGRQGSQKLFVEGKAAALVMHMTAHNGSNANMPAGNYQAPGQVDVTST
jgi:hypothetical protein